MGTGPFFGQPTQPQDATLSENMDLSPFPRPDLEKSPADGTPTNASRRCPVPATLPPLLHWLILGGRSQAALLPALRHTAENYHAQAQFQAELARTWLPILFTLFVSSTITLLYTLSLFVPYTSMLKELARP